MKAQLISRLLGLSIALQVFSTSVSAVHSQPSSSDLFDVSQGTAVTAVSGLWPGFAAEGMFGGWSQSLEPTNTIFAANEPNGFRHSIEWKTQSEVTLRSFRLFASGDGSFFGNEREFAQFVLKAKSSDAALDFDVVLFSFDPTHPYTFIDSVSQVLLEESIAGPISSQFYRAEFVQWDAGRGFDAPRVIELDGFDTAPAPPTPVPDGTSCNVFGAAIAGLALFRRCVKK